MSKTQNEIQARIAARKARNEKFRPNKYKSEYPQELIELMGQGLFISQVAARWSISMNTFHEWVRMKPAFKEAYDIAIPKCEAIYLAKAQDALEQKDDKGYKYWWSLGALHFGWTNKVNTGNAQVNHTQININSMNVVSNKSDAELLELIQDKIDSNPLLKLPDAIEIDPDTNE